jgi:hypothetical protein
MQPKESHRMADLGVARHPWEAFPSVGPCLVKAREGISKQWLEGNHPLAV